MSLPLSQDRVLFTGSAGFLGQALWKAFVGDYRIRLCDVAEFDAGPHECFVGDVSDPAFCDRAVDGCDAMVIAHMYPRPNDTPTGPFNANVTGTANLLYAGHRAGIQRFCIISSTTAVSGNPPDLRPARALPLVGTDIYSSTKACQEIVARSAHIELGIECAVMRIGYVVDLQTMTDKYGHRLPHPEPGMIDRTDCSHACRRALELEDLSCNVFYLYSLCDEDHCPEGLATFQELDWRPMSAELCQ